MKCTTFAEYEKALKDSRKVERFPKFAYDDPVFLGCGLAGEAGEVANDTKKYARDDGFVQTEERRAAIEAEIGDVLWYAANVARVWGLSLEQCATKNAQKVNGHLKTGYLQYQWVEFTGRKQLEQFRGAFVDVQYNENVPPGCPSKGIRLVPHDNEDLIRLESGASLCHHSGIPFSSVKAIRHHFPGA